MRYEQAGMDIVGKHAYGNLWCQSSKYAWLKYGRHPVGVGCYTLILRHMLWYLVHNIR